MPTCTAIRIFGLSASLLSLLVLATSCGAPETSSRPGASAQPPAGALEQNVPPTPEFATTEIGPSAQAAPGDLTPAKRQDCPKLDSQLYQLTQAPDPIKQAEQLGLKLKQDKIQVLLIVDREDVVFPPGFGVEVGGRSGTRIQAYVPIGQLCALANTAEVLAIRVPAQAVPL